MIMKTLIVFLSMGVVLSSHSVQKPELASVWCYLLLLIYMLASSWFSRRLYWFCCVFFCCCCLHLTNNLPLYIFIKFNFYYFFKMFSLILDIKLFCVWDQIFLKTLYSLFCLKKSNRRKIILVLNVWFAAYLPF